MVWKYDNKHIGALVGGQVFFTANKHYKGTFTPNKHYTGTFTPTVVSIIKVLLHLISIIKVLHCFSHSKRERASVQSPRSYQLKGHMFDPFIVPLSFWMSLLTEIWITLTQMKHGLKVSFGGYHCTE